MTRLVKGIKETGEDQRTQHRKLCAHLFTSVLPDALMRVHRPNKAPRP